MQSNPINQSFTARPNRTVDCSPNLSRAKSTLSGNVANDSKLEMDSNVQMVSDYGSRISKVNASIERTPDEKTTADNSKAKTDTFLMPPSGNPAKSGTLFGNLAD